MRNKGQFVMWSEIEASCGMQVCRGLMGGVWDCPHPIGVCNEDDWLCKTTQNKIKNPVTTCKPCDLHKGFEYSRLTPLPYFPSLHILLFIHLSNKPSYCIHLYCHDTFMMHFRVSKKGAWALICMALLKSDALCKVMYMFQWKCCFWANKTHTLSSFHQIS